MPPLKQFPSPPERPTCAPEVSPNAQSAGQDRTQKDIAANMDFQRSDGLITAVVQDAQSHEVLMVAHMNAEAFRRTCESRRMHYYSRSRQRLWMKGEQSGHIQLVEEIRIDCDVDAAVFRVRQQGNAACHTGYRSCFHRRLEPDGTHTTIEAQRVFDPQQVYGS